jgi:D-alanyl-D-alanine carboxypeptidase (penicillin-binding protein 5/6)
MRGLLTALATGMASAAMLVAGPFTATAAAQGSGSPVGGALLTAEPKVVADGATPPPVHAASYLLADLTTGTVLAAKAPHAKLRPASTLKTLTALVLLPRLTKTDVVVGTDKDAGIEGSKVGISPGLRYSVDLLFQGMFLASGNDAVHALANHDAGGIPATTQRMNKLAAQLGALDTHVTDPTGLDADGQYSSAYDLALFAQAGLARPDFAKYAGTKYTTFPLAKTGTYQVANQNRLLFGYDGALGVKTGYTTLARNTFVGAARRDGHTLVVTLMNSPHGITEDASRLLDWGFLHYDALNPIGTLVKPAVPAPATGKSRESERKAVDRPTLPKRSRTVLASGQAVQAIVFRIPVWAYAAPPILLLGLFLRRPRGLRVRNRRSTRSRRH